MSKDVSWVDDPEQWEPEPAPVSVARLSHDRGADASTNDLTPENTCNVLMVAVRCQNEAGHPGDHWHPTIIAPGREALDPGDGNQGGQQLASQALTTGSALSVPAPTLPALDVGRLRANVARMRHLSLPASPLLDAIVAEFDDILEGALRDAV